MVRIRMQRTGRTNRPFYRIAAIDKRARRNGPVIEQLGWYDPIAKDASKQVSLNEERVKYWLGVGAQPSDTCRDMFAKRNLIDRAEWEAQRTLDREKVKKKLEAVAAGEKKAEGEAKPAAKPEAKPEAKTEEKKEG